MSRRDRAVDRDADEAAVRDEVDEFLAGLTQTWSSTGVDARATTRPDSPGRALEPVDDVLGLRSPVRVQNMTADYLHRPAVDDEVREVLERMRRATLDLDPDHLRVLRERREMNDDGTLDGVQLDRDARAPYVMDGVEPPWYAKSYYKVVAAVGARALDPTEDPALRRSASRAAEEAFRAGAGTPRARPGSQRPVPRLRLRVRWCDAIHPGNHRVPPRRARSRRRTLRLAHGGGLPATRSRCVPRGVQAPHRAARHRARAMLEPGPTGRPRVLRHEDGVHVRARR